MSGSLEWASDALTRMPLQQRLTLRAHYATRLGSAGREVFTLNTDTITTEAFDEMSKRIRELLAVKVVQRRDLSPLEKPIYEVLNRAIHSCESLSIADMRELAKALEHLDVPELQSVLSVLEAKVHGLAPESRAAGYLGMSLEDFQTDLMMSIEQNNALAEEWRFAVADYVSAMLASARHRIAPSPQLVSAEPDMDRAVEEIYALASHLAFLEQMLNDFVGADLRLAELNGVSLEGLRWSDRTTQWPEGWRERVEQDSIHMHDDVYEVHHGTHTRGRSTLV